MMERCMTRNGGGESAPMFGNAMEEAAQRYWRASRIWRDKEDAGNITVEDMITECNSLRCYRGHVQNLAATLLHEVVYNHQPHEVDTAATIEMGQ